MSLILPLVGAYGSSAAAPETDFIMTVQTTGASETFAIVCVTGGTFDATIDWGDGGGTSAITAYNDADLSHVYATANTYEIRISGSFPNIRFRDNATHRTKVRTVTNLGDVGWTNLYGAFNGCTGLTSFVAGNTDTSSVTDMGRMFEGCSAMTTCTLTGMSTAACTTMRSMFDGVSTLTSLDVTGFNTTLVTDMRYMFQNMNALTSLDVTGFDTVAVTNFQAQFRYLTNMSGLDPSGFDLTALNSTSGLSQWVESFTLSTSVYDALLIAFEAQAPLSGVTLDVGSSTYTSGGAAATARASLVGTYGWTINDGGTA